MKHNITITIDDGQEYDEWGPYPVDWEDYEKHKDDHQGLDWWRDQVTDLTKEVELQQEQISELEASRDFWKTSYIELLKT